MYLLDTNIVSELDKKKPNNKLKNSKGYYHVFWMYFLGSLSNISLQYGKSLVKDRQPIFLCFTLNLWPLTGALMAMYTILLPYVKNYNLINERYRKSNLIKNFGLAFLSN